MPMLRRLWDLAGLGTTAKSVYECGMLMKIYLEFDMYEEKSAFDDAYNGTMYRAVLQEFDEWLKRQELPLLEIEDARNVLVELLNDHDVTLWD
uniref:Uncharacterized protein n=1 Tax=viral metagenome TaxID=1070528 RepID=A0A6M3KZY0_9ZZZZ